MNFYKLVTLEHTTVLCYKYNSAAHLFDSSRGQLGLISQYHTLFSVKNSKLENGEKEINQLLQKRKQVNPWLIESRK